MDDNPKAYGRLALTIHKASKNNPQYSRQDAIDVLNEGLKYNKDSEKLVVLKRSLSGN